VARFNSLMGSIATGGLSVGAVMWVALFVTGGCLFGNIAAVKEISIL